MFKRRNGFVSFFPVSRVLLEARADDSAAITGAVRLPLLPGEVFRL